VKQKKRERHLKISKEHSNRQDFGKRRPSIRREREALQNGYGKLQSLEQNARRTG